MKRRNKKEKKSVSIRSLLAANGSQWLLLFGYYEDTQLDSHTRHSHNVLQYMRDRKWPRNTGENCIFHFLFLSLSLQSTNSST